MSVSLLEKPQTGAAIPQWLRSYGGRPSEWASAVENQPQLNHHPQGDLQAKFEANLAWMGPYGITAAQWAVAAFDQPQLYSQETETLKANFDANLAWLKPYGVISLHWVSAALKSPQLFYLSPEHLQEKFEVNLAWVKPYGITSAKWAKAALNHPQLLYQKTETLQQNFTANMAWLAPYGVSEQNWAQMAIKQPPLFYQSPSTIRKNFELLMILIETPAFQLPRGSASSLQKQVTWVLSKPNYLCLAESNILLRLAFAEITQPKPAAKLVNAPRGEIESQVVRALGFDACKKVLSGTGGKAIPKIDKEEVGRLILEMQTYADLLRTNWRVQPTATEPRALMPSILSVLLPEHTGPLTPEGKVTLVRGMIGSGLLKGYKLAG